MVSFIPSPGSDEPRLPRWREVPPPPATDHPRHSSALSLEGPGHNLLIEQFRQRCEAEGLYVADIGDYRNRWRQDFARRHWPLYRNDAFDFDPKIIEAARSPDRARWRFLVRTGAEDAWTLRTDMLNWFERGPQGLLDTNSDRMPGADILIEMDPFERFHHPAYWGGHGSPRGELVAIREVFLSPGALAEVEQHLDENSRVLAHLEPGEYLRMLKPSLPVWQAIRIASQQVGYGGTIVGIRSLTRTQAELSLGLIVETDLDEHRPARDGPALAILDPAKMFEWRCSFWYGVNNRTGSFFVEPQ